MVMHLPRIAFFILMLGLLLLTGCATTQPVKYRALASTETMSPHTSKDDAHTPYSYVNPAVVWSHYSRYMLDPTSVYSSSDAQFGKISANEKSMLATYMHDQFQAKLGQKFDFTQFPEPGTLRIRLTLTGAETSTPVLSPMTKIIPVGAVVNTTMWALGKQAAFTGSVTYAVEIYDAMTGTLLDAFIAKQYPAAMNVPASFTSLGATKTGIRIGAKRLTETLTNKGVVPDEDASKASKRP